MSFGGQPWAPAIFTPPLSADFPSDGPHLLKLVQRYWRTEGQPVQLDEWQRELLTAILERYPADHPDPAKAGRLRYRQVVVSVARQNGKSLLAAILSLYGLLQHSANPNVIGVASTKEQAEIVYQRTYSTILNAPAIHKLIKPTGTRGLRFRDGRGSYMIKASKGDALQGLPVTLGIVDELHITAEEVWDSLVTGQRAQRDGILIGITTAGSEDSKLLKRLYAQGQQAVAGEQERFGFFCWEAPEGSTIDTPGAMAAASPSIACGRIDLDTAREDVRSQPVENQQRYTLNRFVTSAGTWLPLQAWNACANGGLPADLTEVVFSVEKTAGWEHASIVATAKINGSLHTELVATLEAPTLDQLERICEELATKTRSTFAMSSQSLGALAKNLKQRGHEVWRLTPTEVNEACSLFYAKVSRRELSHNDGALIKLQLPIAQRKNYGDAWRLAPTTNALGIDAVLATIYGVQVAETKPAHTSQLF